MRIPFLQRKDHVTLVSSYLAGVPQWAPRNYLTFALEGLAKSPTVYGCMAVRSQSASEVKLKAQQKIGKAWVDADDLTTATPRADALQRLLDRPNPLQSQSLYLQDVIQSLDFAGNSYTQIELTKGNQPLALWHLDRPDLMAIIPDPVKKVAGYQYNPGGTPITLEPQVVIHQRHMQDPLNPLLGLPPMAVAARDVDVDNSASDFLKQFFDRGGVPAWAAIFNQTVSKAMAKEFRQTWEETFSINQGGNAAGGVAVLNGRDVKMEKLGYGTSQREAGLTDIRLVIDARICSAFRVHPQVAYVLLGFFKPTYAQARMAQEITWQLGLCPLYVRLADQLSITLEPYFPDCQIVPDFSQVSALQEDQTELWNRHLAAATGGFETREEFREAVGLPDKPKGTFLVPYNHVEQEPGQPLGAVTRITENVPATLDQVQQQQGEADAGKPGQLPTGQAPQLPAPPVRVNERVQGSKAARRGNGQRLARRMERLRQQAVSDTEPHIDQFFSEMADRVAHRVSAQETASLRLYLQTKAAYPFTPDDLVPDSESRALVTILKPVWLAALEAGWEAAASEFGLDSAFSVTNPHVAAFLRTEGAADVTSIMDATRAALKQALSLGAERGYSARQLADGVPDDDFAGIRSLVAETYKNRGETIARTEIGKAANRGATALYRSEGIDKVLVYDGNQDEACAAANGATWDLDRADSEPLAHPSCTRCFAPVVTGTDDDKSYWERISEKRGNEPALLGYWRDRMAGGHAGDYDDCVATLSDKPGIGDPHGLCAWLHHQATGAWPGHAAGESRR